MSGVQSLLSIVSSVEVGLYPPVMPPKCPMSRVLQAIQATGATQAHATRTPKARLQRHPFPQPLCLLLHNPTMISSPFQTAHSTTRRPTTIRLRRYLHQKRGVHSQISGTIRAALSQAKRMPGTQEKRYSTADYASGKGRQQSAFLPTSGKSIGSRQGFPSRKEQGIGR